MESYKPPFTISNKMLELVSSISEKIGKIHKLDNLNSRPYLRKNNRILSIHSSLKIEANSLSINEVRDVIDGKTVLGIQKEIQEVKNAYLAYEEIPNINPTSISNLKRIHSILTHETIEESGDFRKGNEGVFSGDKCIFVAPPPDMAKPLISSLLSWLETNKDTIHPLILAAVFHYEFVFIHPFADGNGRIARLWHTVILYKWRKIFEYVPIENQILKFQQEYYNAIAKSHKNANSNIFIEFVLEMIDKVLDSTIAKINNPDIDLSKYVTKLLKCMKSNIAYSANDILNLLGLKSKETLRKKYLNPAIKLSLIEMTIPNKPRSKNQRYIKK